MTIERHKGADKKRNEKWDEAVAVHHGGKFSIHVYGPWSQRERVADAIKAAIDALDGLRVPDISVEVGEL